MYTLLVPPFVFEDDGPLESPVIFTLIWPLSPKHAIAVERPASAIVNSTGSVISALVVVVQLLASVIVTL